MTSYICKSLLSCAYLRSSKKLLLASLYLSVCPSTCKKNRVPLIGFSLNMLFDYFKENSSCTELPQEKRALYVANCAHLS